jgi:hypothetical protein
VAVGLTALGGWAWLRAWRGAAEPAAAARPIPGETDRVVVEVLNATGVTGLARGATRRLRDAGLDVVYFGSDTTEALDSTEVLLRRGDAAAAERVRRALGAGRVRAAPDAARLVDVTVRLGADAVLLGRDP